ncbi:MAG: PrsW family glutamic-type intramembrane protease [Spirochaetales bacterium]|nr:PrsW family glutamic-type intramembrane protease [Spirochaetales bacterium]
MIYLLINIILAIIPALALLIYFYNKDKQKKEPVSLILKVFIFGFLSVIPAVIIEMIFLEFIPEFSSIISIFIKAFIIAALVEEWIKLKTVTLTAFSNKYFDEITDGIVYTITASLGFALFENIFYSIGPASTLILRGVTAVPLHATASGIMGYYIGKSKFENPNLKYKGLAIAVLIHGLYDFFLFYGSWLALMIFPLLFISGTILSRLYKAALKEDRLTGRS